MNKNFKYKNIVEKNIIIICFFNKSNLKYILLFAYIIKKQYKDILYNIFIAKI